MKYRTIVADPPWDHSDGTGAKYSERGERSVIDLPYQTMSVEEIKDLPVADFAEADCWHIDGARGGSNLFLWATTRYLESAFDVVRSWRFTPSVVLVWCKPEGSSSIGGIFSSNVEFVLMGRRGSPPKAHGSSTTRWFTWPRGEHSAKPEAFLDLVEQISPGPYLELFARRQRLGWDTWGNEALEHVEMGA